MEKNSKQFSIPAEAKRNSDLERIALDIAVNSRHLLDLLSLRLLPLDKIPEQIDQFVKDYTDQRIKIEQEYQNTTISDQQTFEEQEKSEAFGFPE